MASDLHPMLNPIINTDMVNNSFKQKIFFVTDSGFNDLAMEIFYHQAKNNAVYAKYLQLINVRPQQISKIEKIPYLPIEFFKSQTVVCNPKKKPEHIFISSSTTNSGLSRHYVSNINIYNLSIIQGFERVFGPIKNYCFRFLLPSYMQREGSSLIYMANKLLQISGDGGFYLDDFNKLALDLMEDIRLKKKVILLGVSFALMDFAQQFSLDLSNIIIMETGGMKGQRKEITRSELHEYLKKQFNTNKIASEYGMTELLSQAYALKDGLYTCPPWMKISVNSTTDPFEVEPTGKTGQLNIIDLANINSCCFIKTADLGKVYPDEKFEVLGRFDHSETRGCNLLMI